jgi:hypothetical protein
MQDRVKVSLCGLFGKRLMKSRDTKEISDNTIHLLKLKLFFHAKYAIKVGKMINPIFLV